MPSTECGAFSGVTGTSSPVARSSTSREPTGAEIGVLEELYRAELTHFTNAPEAALALAAPKGLTLKVDESANPIELAAWTVVANALLNLDETITKG